MYNNRDRIIIVVIIFTIILSVFTVFISSHGAPSLSARSAALYQPQTKRFLFTKNEDEKLGMASTTKIMTALIALELLEPDEPIQVDGRAVGIEGSSIYLEKNEELRAIDLVYALLLQSANDAAAALAYKISGSIEDFAKLMNQKATELGLTNTNFTNPHGLDDKEHYTTAHDLAIISAEALKNEKFKEISSTYKLTVESSAKKRLLVNHNKLLKRYDGCIGVKTGYTKKTGRCLVSAAERDGLTMIAVTINAPSDWSDHIKMLDYGYSVTEIKSLAYEGEYSFQIPVVNGCSDFVKVSNTDSLKHIFEKGKADFETNVRISRFAAAPIVKGDILGEVVFTKNGEIIGSVKLFAEKGIAKQIEKRRFFKFSNR